VNGGVVGQFDANNHWDEAWRSQLYTSHSAVLRGDARAARLVAAITDRQPELRWADQNLFVDLQLRLGGGYLTKVDIASNMVSLEVRSPFLDHEVVEFAARLPLERKLLHGEQKGLLREYARRVLPAEITTAPKRGFAPALDQWLRGPWSDLVEEIPSRSTFVKHGLFRESVVRDMCESHLNGRRDHGQRLWSLICLDRWAESFLG
jgi:asparagine synthase (glutamine-hydrolysing)